MAIMKEITSPSKTFEKEKNKHKKVSRNQHFDAELRIQFECEISTSGINIHHCI